MSFDCKNIEILKAFTALDPSKENYLKYEDLDYLIEHFNGDIIFYDDGGQSWTHGELVTSTNLNFELFDCQI